MHHSPISCSAVTLLYTSHSRSAEDTTPIVEKMNTPISDPDSSDFLTILAAATTTPEALKAAVVGQPAYWAKQPRALRRAFDKAVTNNDSFRDRPYALEGVDEQLSVSRQSIEQLNISLHQSQGAQAVLTELNENSASRSPLSPKPRHPILRHTPIRINSVETSRSLIYSSLSCTSSFSETRIISNATIRTPSKTSFRTQSLVLMATPFFKSSLISPPRRSIFSILPD